MQRFVKRNLCRSGIHAWLYHDREFYKKICWIRRGWSRRALFKMRHL